jgi:hypothetical protein
MSATSEIGLARRQKAYAVIETTAGTLQFPTATQDYIRPAGNGSINQVPAFADSEELSDTLDLLDQFQNATPPGAWSLPMYIRPAGSVGGRMQGMALFEALQGLKQLTGVVTGLMTSNISTTDTSIILNTVAGGTLPEVGVITIGTEKIRYELITRTSRSATVATLGTLTRGYGGTTATNAATAAAITLNSVYFKQAATSPSLSIWLESDHFMQMLSGATVNNCVIAATNEGGLKATFSGEGMRMYWAGKDALAANALITPNTAIVVSDAKRYTVGAYIWNQTKADSRTDLGYVISAINGTTNTITLANGLVSAWATADVIRGFMPTGTALGEVIEGKDTTVKVNRVTARLKTTDVTLSVPKVYITDELGTEYPEDYLENVRALTTNMNLYFKKADAKYFKDGYSGTEVPLLFTFGNEAGYCMDIFFPRVQLTVPTINIAAPAIELQIPCKALGTVGEDSCDIVFN